MIELIVKYWVEWLLGIIAAGLGIACKKIYKLYKNQKKEAQEEFYDGLKKLIQEGNEASQKADQEIKAEIGVIRNGVLSIQGERFTALCRELLATNHVITPDEYDHCLHEHSIYNSLGGNHDGDAIFKIVEEKAKVDIATK